MHTQAVLGLLLCVALAQNGFEPARLARGGVPRIPRTHLGDLVVLGIQVSASGEVVATDEFVRGGTWQRPIAEQVGRWKFTPATSDGEEVGSSVLVVGVLRPPALMVAGPGLTLPKDMPKPGRELPFPVSMELPSYPPGAVGQGVVLVEVSITRDGVVRSARSVEGATAFDSAALQTARRWRFRPAWWEGRQVPAVACLVFGFQEPVVSRPR